MKTRIYVIGLVYIGFGNKPFMTSNILAASEKDAINKAAGFLRPNHMQTLTLVKVIND